MLWVRLHLFQNRANEMLINLDILLLLTSLLLIAVTIKLAFCKTMIETVILMSVFSMLICVIYLIMDAPDVAMTEAALGACLSTCILLNLIKIIKDDKPVKQYSFVAPAILCVIFIAVLTFASFDLPEYGDAASNVQTHVSKYYIENTKNDIGIPSIVAAVLASYRGYDTLGETTVILIAGLGVLLILSAKGKRSD